MNPPPITPDSSPAPKSAGKTFAHQAAAGSLLAPLIVILVNAALHASSQTPQMSRTVVLISGFACLTIIVAGFAMAIVGLCGVKRHGARGLLGKSIAGLLINGLLLILFVIGFTIGLGKGLQSRQLNQDLTSTVQDMQANTKRAYNPKTGLTNTDFKSMERLQSQLDTAAQTMSGDDALISQAMSRYVARLQGGMKKYQEVVAELRAANVLNLENLSEKEQITTRREAVQNFIAASDAVKTMITNSEDSIRADLTGLEVPPQKIDSLIAGFDVKFAPRSALDLQIRECDSRMGQAMLEILDLLETNWGKWDYDPAMNLVRFEDADAQRSYRQFLAAIKSAGQEQVKAQGELVNLPQ